MSWVDAVWPGVVAIALLLVPGAFAGYFLGLRRLALLGLAPVFSISVLVCTAVVISPMHVRWGVIPVVVATLICGALAWITRRLVSLKWPTAFAPAAEKGLTRYGLAGVVISAVAIGWRLMATIGVPSNISQTYDAVFHLSAIRYILNSGVASTLAISGLPATGLERAGFYPAGWHDLTSLVVMITGASIPVGISAVTVVIGALAWPLGLMFLTRVIAGSRKLPLVVAGIIGTGFAAFPYLMMDFGVVYAFLLGLALVPALWALAINALGFATDPPLSRPASVVAILVALPGITLAHPSATAAVIALCGPMVLLLIIRAHRRMRAANAPVIRIVGLYVGAVVLLALVAAFFYKIQPGNFWKPQSTWLKGIIDLVADSPVGLGPAVLVSLLVTTGLVSSILLRRHVWLVLSWVMFAGLFVVAAAVGSNLVRAALIGMWYGDVYRLAALLAIVEAPLAILGLVWLIDFLRRRIPAARLRPMAQISAALVLVAALVGVQFSNLDQQQARGHQDYIMDAQSKLLTPNELALLNQVAAIVPVDVKIAGNPWTGTSLVYAYANRIPLLARPGVKERGGISAITQHLQEAATDPAVCASVLRNKVGFVLDFGGKEVHGENHVYAGLTNLAQNPSVTKVAEVGGASLWRITACGLS